ncbi:MAG: ribonuclease J, partial [Oscillospiraceae bacterium]|nr:ribonuclease J [Oscillospiraceae bacterium]
DIEEVGEYREDELLIMTTGSQGEPMSALSRIAASDHRTISIIPGDLVIISANPIPGNEKFISKVINELYKKGAEVIYEAIEDIHVSGHACQEELKLIYSLTKPRYFMPVHGEYRHLWQHARMIGEMGLPEKDIYVMENGQVLELTANSAKLGGNVQAGRILVDGHGVGDVGAVVLRDRKLLSQDGLIIVVITVDEDDGGIISGPEIISRGFVYVKESEDLMDSMRSVIENAVRKAGKVKRGEWGQRKNEIREALRDFIYSKTKRKPMILPIIMEA